MSFITYPLNNIDYSAEDAELFHCTRTSGIYAEDSFSVSVSGADNTVSIGKGIAWIKNGEFSGKVVAQKADVTLDLGVTDDTLPRIDAIAIQFSANDNKTELVHKVGVPSSSPIPPSVVREERLYELHLYHIRRNAGELSVKYSDITDVRLSSEYCGIMADSVTRVDTSAISNQINSLIEETKETTDNLIDGYEARMNELIEEGLQQAKDSGEFDGYTPQRGTDYWTESDKNEIVNQTLSALPTWTGGSY